MFDDMEEPDVAEVSGYVQGAVPADWVGSAGVCAEHNGRVEEADRYFDKAGEVSSKKLQALFD